MRIVTINGAKIKKINAIMYKDQYYSKKNDCVKIGGKYYTKDNPEVVMDHETKELNLRQRMSSGIVSFNGGEAVYGYFTPNVFKNVVCEVVRGTRTSCISDTIIPSGYVEEVNTGIFYNSKWLDRSSIEYLSTIRTVTSHTNKAYNIEENIDEYALKRESYVNNVEVISKKVKRLGAFLGDLTFGIENEVVVGSIPDRILFKRGLVLCRDGSVDAGEFVSVPMTGAKGVNNIALIGEEMSKRTIHDNHCAYHIHFGNIASLKQGGAGKRQFLLSLYKLVELIQDEMFTMLPYYKTFWKGIKKKNYNKKLETIFPVYEQNTRVKNFREYLRYNYAKLFRMLGGVDALPCKKLNSSQKKHPSNGMKWNIESRYSAVNFVNAIFHTRNTIEFRAHQDTTNPTKMVAWLYICAAIIKYAEKYSGDILTKNNPVSLKDIVNIYKELHPKNVNAEFLSNYLDAYIEDRKEYFTSLIEKEDYHGYAETKADKEFVFKFENKTLI